MEDEDYNENQMKLYSAEFLKTVSDLSPLLNKALGEKDRKKICEFLTKMFVDNLFTYGKIRRLLGYNADRLNEEEIENIQRRILELIK